eukprot:jgi/Mesen1/9235/ME000006S09236
MRRSVVRWWGSSTASTLANSRPCGRLPGLSPGQKVESGWAELAGSLKAHKNGSGSAKGRRLGAELLECRW